MTRGGRSGRVCDHVGVILSDRADDVAATPFGLYVHVPFCERRCGYCAFTTVAVGDPSGGGAAERIERYVDAAVGEIRTAAGVLGGTQPSLTSVFFGGGTPTMLSAAQLGRVLDAVRESFEVRDDLEVTVESNPDGLRPDQLAGLRDVGVTRMSFGMQSIRRRVLELLDRTHDPERALAAVAEARSVGFDHVSLDLIYGTPGETAEDWAATLDAVVSTDVDHVSAYSLGIEAGTKLAARVRRGELPNPDDDVAADRYLEADGVLGGAGFSWYEISNWARSDDARCRHNLLYWRNQNWWVSAPVRTRT
jgi:putative oxygen-independent coproporphyrinogen III oxidase